MSKDLDVVFIAPGNHKAIFQDLAKADYPAIEPPVWAGLFAGRLRAKNKTSIIIDQSGENLSSEQVAKKALNHSAKLIVFVIYGHQPSASTQTMSVAYEINELIKESSNRPTLFIGGHPSALPKQTLSESNMDFVCQGEGPSTIDALLEIQEFSNVSDLKKVPGLWFRHNNQIIKAIDSKVIPQESLDQELPGIAWDMLPMKNYRAHNWHALSNNFERQPYASLYTSLGCPFRCSFCCINAPFGKPSIRYWSPKFIAGELEILAKDYGVKNLKIVDEMFVLNENHVMGLTQEIIDRNLDFNIWAYARIDTIKPKFLTQLKKAGVNWLVLGIESGSKHVRDGVQKGRFTLDHIKQAVKQVRDHGIYVHGNYIFGLPDDDLNSMNETLDLAMELNTEFANFYSAMAYPGSKLYTEAIEKNWALPAKWQDFSQHSYATLPLPTEHLSAGEVLGFRDQAWQKYFTNPDYLQMLENTFGVAASEDVKKLSKVRLQRKFVTS